MWSSSAVTVHQRWVPPQRGSSVTGRRSGPQPGRSELLCRIDCFQVARHVRPNPLCLRAMRGHASESAWPVACHRDGTTTLPRPKVHLDQSAMIIVTFCMIRQGHGTVTITPSAPANYPHQRPVRLAPTDRRKRCRHAHFDPVGTVRGVRELGFHQGRRISDVARDKLASNLKTKDEKGAGIRAFAESTRQSYGRVHWAHSTSV